MQGICKASVTMQLSQCQADIMLHCLGTEDSVPVTLYTYLNILFAMNRRLPEYLIYPSLRTRRVRAEVIQVYIGC